VTIKVPSDTSYVLKISKEILDYLDAFNISDSLRFDVRLCIEEALRNAIEHGNKLDKSLHVIVSYGVQNGELEITIEDQGKGFDVQELPNPTHDDNIDYERGRGVFLIHKLMDMVQYNEKGNRVTMKKKLN
jgi:serine/threonine-protein kinase RsbW